MSRLPVIVFACAISLTAVGCTTRRQTNSERTATQQILMTEAIDRALAQVTLPPFKERRVLVQTFTAATEIDRQYLQGAAESLLIEQGASIVTDPARADYVVTVLAGAIGTDASEVLLGTPRVETLFATLPELALYKAEMQQGLAKISIAVHDADNGDYTYRSKPAQATTYVRSRRFLFFGRYETDTSRYDPSEKEPDPTAPDAEEH